MQRLFRSLENESISYLHFKSNTNLKESLMNRADFDVLVDKERIIDIERVLSACNGKRHNPPHIGNYPGVDNWLVFDEENGEIYHLHLHYQLATGKFLVKDYILPWNDLLFATRVKDPESGIYITDPNLELILLAVRSVLKAKPFDYLKKVAGAYSIPKPMWIEWRDLYQKSSNDRISYLLGCLFPKNSEKLFRCLTKESLSRGDYLCLHRIIRQEMRVNRRLSSTVSTIKSFFYRIEDLSHKFWSRKLGGIPVIKKTSLQGGLIIAFIGVDGAGKSTLSNDIYKWISRKIECKRFYMGTGDGKTTLFASLLKGINGRLPKEGKPRVSAKDEDNGITQEKLSCMKAPMKFIRKYLKMHLIASVERNNLKKIKRMHRYKLNGGISVLDRFPQIEIEGQNDGPKMPYFRQLFGEKWFVKKMESTEMKRLGIVRSIKPDLIFRLNISVETCISRKPENTNREMFEKKICDLRKLNFQNARIIDIDAEMPYEEELLVIKKSLWKFI